jgi:NAD(P)-dependent dehydrogenase (short-subunit alcohol dehydrogenase family)
MDLETLTEQGARFIIDTYRPDVLVNNAGITRLRFNEDLPQESWDEVMAVNLRAPWLLSQAMLKIHGKAAKDITIINVASMGYKCALRCSAAYNASKAGLVALTRQMAREAADRYPGFVFYAVSPNSVGDTGMLEECRRALVDIRGMSEEQSHKYLVASPLGRLERPDEVASTVRYLVMERPVYLTGTNIEHTGAGPT